jgi:hypothetical protein
MKALPPGTVSARVVASSTRTACYDHRTIVVRWRDVKESVHDT